MNTLSISGIVLLASTMATPIAIANPLDHAARLPVGIHATTLADNVVVNPGTPTAPAPVVATPPVIEGSPRHTTVLHHEEHNYMSTIAINSLMGGLAGVLIGGAIYYLGSKDHGYRIGYWAAGGVLVGAAVGMTQVMVQESRAEAAVAATRLPEDPVTMYRVALFQRRF